MLALNEKLLKAGKGLNKWFCRAKNSLLGVVFTLFIKKPNTRLLVLQLSNMLICIVKTIDLIIVGVEILKYWQQFKVYEILLYRYLSKKKMELVKWEIEWFIGLQLEIL